MDLLNGSHSESSGVLMRPENILKNKSHALMRNF